MIKNMVKLGMWRVDLSAERKEISRYIEIKYKGKIVKGAINMRLTLMKMKDDEGGNLLVKDCKKEVKL